MSSSVTVKVNGEPRVVPVGTVVREVLKDLPSKDLVAARIDGKVVDLTRKLEHDAVVEPVLADSPAGLEVIRHSTAHLMAMAVQALYPGTQVTIGPVIEDGFFYDFAPATPFTVDDLPKIEAKMRELAKADHKVQRTEIAREDAIAKFSAMGEKYKVEIIQGIADDHVSIYSQGDWMDLCRGPHVPSTRYLRAFKLTSVAGAYWRGDEHNAMLSRIYGTAFATKEALDEHLKLVELARTRDHRKLGREMGLYIFDPISPGSPFYLPKGTIILNELTDYIRRLYRRYGYDEVVTPQLFRNELWNTSGHWENFRENMFLSPDPEGEDTTAVDSGPDGWHQGYALKPMNCPGHTFVYRAQKRSYRDLPLRVAEFSRLHRAERSGTLHGLMRVRSMSQDDAHIFCREDQIEDEVASNLAMVRDVYGALGFERVEFKLATMPDAHLGTEEQWRMAEAKLGKAM
ncbi:MAG TPA: threonine--tRNA ligase, partial [Candidatus Acidoferrales bacterium]|nr:threonine--tRNA ligase [Candidatus Acidoferrales bacterium]